MAKKRTYEELEQRVKKLEKEAAERKWVEGALRDSETRLQLILQTMPSGLFTVDLTRKITYWNKEAERITGLKAEEVIGKECLEAFDCNECKRGCALFGGKVHEPICEKECEIHIGDRDIAILKNAGFLLDWKGNTIGGLESFIDVSEHKRAQAALRKAHDELERRVEERTAKLAATTEQLKLELTERKQAEEALSLAHMQLKKKAVDLQLANEELSQYNHVVAHLLKEPLRAIRNYADFLREDLDTTFDGDQKDHFDSLDGAVSQGVKLVDDLLEFSMVGRGSVPTQKIEIGLFLQELVASLDLSPDVEVVMGNDWPTIDAEPTLLRRIFQNVISNAIKFHDSPQKRIEIGWLPGKEEKHYEFFVRDNGIGIEPRYHEQIFGVCQRLHTREEYEGTGVGLAVVKKATNKLGGSIRVESRPGKGTTFFIVLPNTQE